MPPDLRHEAAYAHRGPVAGVDEAGRGPWAGPVAAAAAVLDPDDLPHLLAMGLDDSKRVTPRRRAALALRLRERHACAIAWASVAEIDALDILRATDLAMARALAALPVRPGLALIDGTRVPPNLPCAGAALVGGDARAASIAAASILAKTWRDGLMVEAAQQFPGYGFDAHKGYGSKSHSLALQRLGPCPIHRRAFAPIRKMLWQGPIAPGVDH